MKRKMIAIVGLLTGALLFVLTTFVGCSSNAEETKSETVTEEFAEHKEKHSCCDEMETDEMSEESVYLLESEWTNQENKSFKLKELEGKKVVMTMFFASCTYACPILVNDMKRIEEAISKEDDVDEYSFLLVSIDHERDNPAKLKEFATRYNLDEDRWTLLSGSADDIIELAAVTGFKYKKDENGEYSHSNIITFLNEKGEIIHQQVGLNQDVTPSTAKLFSMN
jgi:protein SCO1/2